jgi:hypothetical protein
MIQPTAMFDQMRSQLRAEGCTCGDALTMRTQDLGPMLAVFCEHKRECPIMERHRRIEKAEWN